LIFFLLKIVGCSWDVGSVIFNYFSRDKIYLCKNFSWMPNGVIKIPSTDYNAIHRLNSTALAQNWCRGKLLVVWNQLTI